MNESATFSMVNDGRWCQITFDTGNPGIRRATKWLRNNGYIAVTSNMGYQITEMGSLKLTMITIKPGIHSDTFYVPKIY